MATYMPNEELAGLDTFDNVRQRRVSERSEVLSETDSHTQLPTIARRKKFLRSLTDATFINVDHPIDDVLKTSEAITSRENLSRHDSSISVDAHVGQDDIKTITSLETEGSKDILEGETIGKKEILSEKEMSRDTSREMSREMSREISVEATSREVSRETSREASKEASSENPPSDIRQDSEHTLRQDSAERSTFRQNSRTRSESDDFVLLPPPGIQRAVTWAEPRVAVIPSSVSSTGSGQRSILLTMRAEYTSITDELESYCGLLSPPRTPPISPPPSRMRNMSDMSNPEMAWQIENEHLRDAEECDYQQMEDLIQRRYHGNDNNDEENDGPSNAHADEDDIACFFNVSNEHRQLRRASAIEEDPRRPPPTISVTREIEQTLARPPIRDAETTDLSDKNLSTVPAPASEIMC